MKKTLIILDVLMVLAILANCGAYAITNAIVVKNNPGIEIYEGNPAVRIAETDFATPPPKAVKQITNKFLIKAGYAIFLGAVLGLYIFYRRRVKDWRQLLTLCIAVSIWFTMLFLNFWNDFGYWVAML